MLLFDHLCPGETGPGICEGAAGLLVLRFGQAGDEEVVEAGVADLIHA